MVKNSKTFGPQVTMFDPAEHVFLATGDSQETENVVTDSIKHGFQLFRFGSGDTSVWYRSKNADGLCRNVEEYVSEHGFHVGVNLYNYEPVQAIWQENVDAWFDAAMGDVSAQAEFLSMGATEELLLQIRDRMRNLRIERVGKTGQRPQKVMKYISKNLRQIRGF